MKMVCDCQAAAGTQSVFTRLKSVFTLNLLNFFLLLSDDILFLLHLLSLCNINNTFL